MTTDEKYIQMCLDLARQGMGAVSPNPLVGSVIVKDGKIIGKGYHQIYGGPHAEPNTISNSTESVEGATLYCNLEPCCHTNKQTPPCTDKIIESKIARVVIANLDPNPEVSGRGLKLLKEAGISVTHGILEDKGHDLNKVFFKYIKSQTPYIHIKLAQTLDGKIATRTGDSKWISNDNARRQAHSLRLQYDAVLIGRSTLLADDPSLSIRMGVESKGKIPYRIIMGSIDKMDFSLKLFSDGNEDKTVIITTCESFEQLSTEKRHMIDHKNINLIFGEIKNGSYDISKVLIDLAKLKISSILVEGGRRVISAFINQGAYDEISFFICPKLIGNGISYFENSDLILMKDAITFSKTKTEMIDEQVIIHAYK